MQVFKKNYRTYYDDVDMGGVVYHGNYVKIIEHARSDWLVELGVDQVAMIKTGFGFVVRSLQLDYLAPAYMGEDLTVETSVIELGRTSCTFQQRVLREKDAITLCNATVKIVYINREFKPTALPDYMRQLG